MRAFLPFLVLTALLLLCAGAPVCAATAADDLGVAASGAAGRLDEQLAGEILRAVGKGDAPSILRYEASLRRAVEEIERRAGHSRSPYRTAHRIHSILHESFLRRYEASADGIDSILDRGEYNCVSASLFYGIVARAFGIEAEVVEIPRHVYVLLTAGVRVIEIESTSRVGFDLRHRLAPALASQRQGELSEESLGAGGGEAAGRVSAPPVPARVVNLESAVAFVWYNSGRRELEKGDALQAASRLREAARLQPELASGSGTLASLLARAFRREYEEGRFDSAYRIAEIDLEIFPGTTSARDRLLAAATKRIAAACDAGSPASAEEILSQTAARTASRSDQIRMDRGACPLIAASAVRIGDWDRAARMVARYSASEPDRVETSRLARWVASRELKSLRERGRNSCADPGPADLAGLVFGEEGGDPSHPDFRGAECAPRESPPFGGAPEHETASPALD
jgi:tetratricopeptide (TPR) repeat protein